MMAIEGRTKVPKDIHVLIAGTYELFTREGGIMVRVANGNKAANRLALK